MEKRCNIGHEKLDRKLVEKKRRIYMKDLCSKLTSVIPPHHLSSSLQGTQSRMDQLHEAGTYIKLLVERLEKLKARKAALGDMGNHDATKTDSDTNIEIDLPVPVVEVRECLGSCLEVVLITGLEKKLKISQVIAVIEDERAEVVDASFSTVGDKVIHTLHAQVEICRVGVDTVKVCQRLKELVC